MKTYYEPEAATATLFAVAGNPWALPVCYLLAVNLITFLAFGLDKWKAKRKIKNDAVRRVPEKTLFLLAAIGGSVGALLGMKAFHHKTLHKSFRFGIPAILIAQVVLAAGIWAYVRFLH